MYLKFCRVVRFPPLPASPETLQLYAVFLSDYIQVGSIPNYLSALQSLHIFKGFKPPSPDTSLPLTLQGIRRTFPKPVKQVLPISLETLGSIISRFTAPELSGLKAGYLCAFFGFLRKANVVPPSANDFNAARHLTRSDFTFFPWGMLVRIKCTKTRSYGDSPIVIPFVRIPNSPLCPVAAASAHFALIPAVPSSSAFLFHQGQMITHSSFVSRLRLVLEEIGLNPKAYSGHSFRRGGASFAASLAQSHEAIRNFGDWKSDCYLRYIDSPITLKSSLARAFSTAISTSPPVIPTS